MPRWAIWLVVVAAVVAIAVVVSAVAIVSTLNAQDREQDYEECMAMHGFDRDSSASDRTLDEVLTEGVEAAEYCSKE